MRDHIRLAGDLYLPTTGRPPWPAILIRTPYDKSDVARLQNAGGFWAGNGYACFVQDCRGRHRSEGSFYKYVQEAQDGYDTVEWMALQDWCDGNVGTVGGSYLTHVQTSMAALNPPHLKAMFCIKGGFFNAYTSGIRQGGAFEFRQMVWAFRQGSVGAEARRDPWVRKAFESIDLAGWLLRYPFKRGYSPISPAPSYETYLFDQLENSEYSDYWQQIGLNTEPYLEQFADIPILFVGSWYDIYARSTIEFYDSLTCSKKSPIRLIMGPWSHDDEDRVAGEVDFGDTASRVGGKETRLNDLALRWFDRWLKGQDNGVERDPPVRFFRMGGGDGRRTTQGHMRHGGEWCVASSWPPTGLSQLRLYLAHRGQLKTALPDRAEGVSGYQYDPRRPVPTVGGNLFRYENILWPGAYDQRERPDFFLSEPPCLPLAARSDVLVFRTEPLEKDLDVTGTIRAHLFVASSAPDTDFTVKIVDEHPPNEDYPLGFAMNVTHGIMRCRYRQSWEEPVLMESGQVYAVEVVLYPTSNLFRKGHRLRVDISSSNYPHFDVNTNTGEPCGTSQRVVVADNLAYHNRRYPSHVILPVVS